MRGGVQIEVEGTRVTELVGAPFLPCWYAMGRQPTEVEVSLTEEEEGGVAGYLQIGEERATGVAVANCIVLQVS